MKIHSSDLTRGCQWPAAVALFALLLAVSNIAVVSSSEPAWYAHSSPPPPYEYKSPPPPSPSPPPPYEYKSPPPPSPSPPPPYYYNSPPPPMKSPPPPYYYTSPPPPYHHKPTIKIFGKVFCYECYQKKHVEEHVDYHMKKPLGGAIVKVTCSASYNEYIAYSTTKKDGEYRVDIMGFPYWKYGAKACKVELYKAPEGSLCKIPVKRNQGVELRVKHQSDYEVLLFAKPLGFAPETPYKECESKAMPPTYYYKSPPPPSPSPPPPYYYQSTPPPSPSPPPPSYYYKSPPPPTYVYSSPPPPTYY